MTKPIWRGWTLVDERGRIVVDKQHREPFTWTMRSWAEASKEEGQRVVRCELRASKP